MYLHLRKSAQETTPLRYRQAYCGQPTSHASAGYIGALGSWLDNLPLKLLWSYLGRISSRSTPKIPNRDNT